MVGQNVRHGTTLSAVPKQTRPRMVVMNVRVPADVKQRAIERAEREGINVSDPLREFITAWANDEA